ncbi:hypothetical protein LTR84_005869 [Exophiala bonariae]|uniref:AB hydrolase-1 domain-containing protein n=1 Tax=Exophiala bonariae TaxID=1690606 RepID=A0AAV9N5H9_9EURO|nr:hypothetical protein LTR84_005869 [Exophiala bonariae]
MAGLPYVRKALSNGINALVAGTNTSGTPIVCLSGWPQTAEAYSEMLPPLSKSHHVLALDLPGLGDSSPSTTGYTTKTISSILASAVASYLGTSTKYHLVGHDVGAWVAYPWAAHPQYSSSLVSVTFLDGITPGLFPLPEYPLPDAPNMKLWQFSFNRLPELPEILTQGRERAVLDWLFDKKSVHPERITATKRDRYVECYSRKGGMSAGFAYYRAIPEVMKDNREIKAKGMLKVPVLTVGGAQAAGRLMEGVLELTEEREKSRYLEIEDCGHYILEEQPEVASKELLAFIAEVEK